jgi:hypothetical protein
MAKSKMSELLNAVVYTYKGLRPDQTKKIIKTPSEPTS